MKSGYELITVAVVGSMLLMSSDSLARPVFAVEEIPATFCKQDVLNDASGLTAVAGPDRAAARAAVGEEVLYQLASSTSTEDYVLTTTRYYSEKITSRKAIYRCVAEKKVYDGRFSAMGQTQSLWYDRKASEALTILWYYDFAASERPLVGITVRKGGQRLSLSSRDEERIGVLQEWSEAVLAEVSGELANRTKRVPAAVASDFILTRASDSDMEMIDLATGYSLGLSSAESRVAVPVEEAAVIRERLGLGRSRGELYRSMQERTLHHYGDLYLFPSLGWGGGHLTIVTEKTWSGEHYFDERGRLIGSHATVTGIHPVADTKEFWFTSKGLPR